jgi:hypothetical protein
MAFSDRPHDARYDDPFRDQRTSSLFDGASFWFLVALIIVITALALIYPGPDPQVATDSASRVVAAGESHALYRPEAASSPGEPRPTQAPQP